MGDTKKYFDAVKKATKVQDPLKPPYNSPIPAFNLLANALDLLMDVDKLETLLENLSEKERSFLYNHPLLNEYDLLP